MSLDPKNQQIETLMTMAGSDKTAHRIGLWTSLVVGISAGVAISTQHPVAIMIAIFVVVVGWSVWETTGHARNAVKGLKSGGAEKGMVTIEVTDWSDSETYKAIVKSDGRDRKWVFEFIPQGWKPENGSVFEADIYYIKGVRWPVAATFGEQVIYPRYEPQPKAN